MLDKKLCQKVLTVGCFSKHPTGGISQVLHTYGQCIYRPFNFVATTCKGGRLAKLGCLAAAIMKFVAVLAIDRRIRIVHIHTASNNSFRRKSLFVKLGKAMGKRIALHVHNGAFVDFYKRNQDWVKPVLDKCDVVVALSDYWKEELQRQCGLSRVAVVDNVICEPGMAVGQKHCNDGKVHFLFLGLYKKEKGIFDLLDAFAQCQNELRGRCVLHIGCDKESEAARRIADARIGDIVTCEGWVDGDRKEQLLEMCDVFVLPSYFEGVPISILESMSHGMAVLATNVGGIPSVVSQGENGILCDAGSVGQLCEAVKYMVGHRDAVDRMGAASAKKVRRNYPEQVSEELKELYESLL